MSRLRRRLVKMSRQHGSAVIILVLLLIVLLGGFSFFLYTSKGKSVEVKDTPMVVNTQEQIEETKATFKVLPETAQTPEVINNQVLDEMDQMIESIEDSENLEDLDTY